MSVPPPPRHQQRPDGTWFKPEGAPAPAGPEWWLASDGQWYPPVLLPTRPPLPVPRGPAPVAIVVASAVIVLASFFPWVGVGARGITHVSTVSGTDKAPGLWIYERGDGWVTIVLGLILAVLALCALTTPRSTAIRTAAIVVAATTIVFLLVVHFHSQSEFDRAYKAGPPNTFEFSFRAAYWFALVGAGFALVGALALRPSRAT